MKIPLRVQKSLIASLLTFLSFLSLTGCATTGDPYEDTLFFSSRKGDEYLEQMRMRIDTIRRQTASLKERNLRIERQLNAAISSRNTTRTQADALKRELADVERSLEAKSAELKRLRSDNRELTREVNQVEQNIEMEMAHLSRLRATVLMSLENR